jgi:transposase-like protein
MSKQIDIDRLLYGRHFDREVIVLCVRWYLRYKLSLRDLVEMMAERGFVRKACCDRVGLRYKQDFRAELDPSGCRIKPDCRKVKSASVRNRRIG